MGKMHGEDAWGGCMEMMHGEDAWRMHVLTMHGLTHKGVLEVIELEVIRD